MKRLVIAFGVMCFGTYLMLMENGKKKSRVNKHNGKKIPHFLKEHH